MAGARLGLGGVALALAVAGCGLQELGASHDAGAPLRAEPAPPSITPVDAATGGVVVRLAPTTVLTSANLGTAEVLAADGDGIYWVNSANQLWMLPTGSSAARELAADPNPPSDGTNNGILLASGGHLLWSASAVAPAPAYFQNPLHRTEKAGGDVVLLSNIWCDRRQVAADGAYLYYPDGGVSNGHLVALPLDADPGSAPISLQSLGFDMVLYSMAVDGQSLYWTEYPVDSTLPVAAGPLFIADKASLLAGNPSVQPLSGYYSIIQPSGELYFEDAPTLQTLEVGRLDSDGSRSILPLPGGDTLVVLGDWAVSATTEVPYPNGKIFAAAADAVAGDGSVAVQIADQVMVPPVAGAPGLVFVDGNGRLVAISPQDLAAAVRAGQP